MRDSIASYATSTEAEVGANLIYAAHQHFGGAETGSNIAPRPFIGLSREDELDLADLVTGPFVGVAVMSATLLSDLPQTICTAIDVILPDLKTCAPHEGKFDLAELKKRGLAAPAVLIAILGAKQDTTYAGTAHSFMFKMSAYVVTRDGLGAPRDVAAANICQVLLGLLPDGYWGLNGVGQARNVAMHSLISGKSKDATASLWAVTWDQPISLFEPEQRPAWAALYVSRAPQVGADREGDYEQIGGPQNEL